MTFRRVVSALAVCGALLAAPHAQQPSQPMFRSATQVVPLYVTVTDATGRLVAGLTKDDFTILDNGVAQQIAVFENESVPFLSLIHI